VQSAPADRVSTEVLAFVDVEQLANQAIDALAAHDRVDRARVRTDPGRGPPWPEHDRHPRRVMPNAQVAGTLARLWSTSSTSRERHLGRPGACERSSLEVRGT
jgi:hypothetical protein